uniref:Putative lambda recombination protein n=1 Tax=viral metagenome TaxID=1070528 RepID=A0A6M3KGK6_9ZZZZ
MAKYTLYMIDRYGRERVDELIRLKRAGRKYSQSELLELRTKYISKIKELRKAKGLL